jgi:mono/diheme cytochrome c family protein
MDIFAKTILASLLLVIGFLATLTMLRLQGGGEKVRKPDRARKIHKVFGFVFFILLLVLVFTGMRYVAWGRGEPSARAVFHVVLAAALFTLFVLKLLIVRFYRGLLGIVRALGMIVFVLTVLVFSTSAGYYLARRGEMPGWGEDFASGIVIEEIAEAPMKAAPGDTGMGAAVYEKYCAFCHHSDSADSKLGPGLKGVLRAETLPVSGRPATVQNILSTLENPIGTMPAFTKLTEEELEALIAFLETL